MGKDDQGDYEKRVMVRTQDLDVTPVFRGVLLDMTVSFLIQQPSDVTQFGTEYFAQLRSKSTKIVKDKYARQHQEEEETEELPTVGDLFRRPSIFGETYNPEEDNEPLADGIRVYPKTDEQRDALEHHIKNVLLFSSLQADEINTIIDAMFKKYVNAGDYIITQGDEGDYFYVIQSGKFNAFSITNRIITHLTSYENQGSFGELALLYSVPRTASVQAVTDGELWCLDRITFRKIVLKSAFKKRKLYEGLIAQVPMLQTLNSYEKMNLADALIPKTYHDGELIMRETEDADGMYFIEWGKVVIKKREVDRDIELITIEKGGYFGELALINKQPRSASAYAKGEVKCAFLTVDAFERLLGPCIEIIARNVDKYRN